MTEFDVVAAEKFCRLIYQGFTVVSATEIHEVRKIAAVLTCGMPRISDATNEEVHSSVKVRISRTVDGQTQLQQPVEDGHTKEADLNRIIRLIEATAAGGVVNFPPLPVMNFSTVKLVALPASNFNETGNKSNFEDNNTLGGPDLRTPTAKQPRNNSTNLPSAMNMTSGGKPMRERMKIQAAVLNSSNSQRPLEPTQTNSHKAENLLTATHASKTSNINNVTREPVGAAVTNAAVKINSKPITTVSKTVKAINSSKRSTALVSILSGVSEQISRPGFEKQGASSSAPVLEGLYAKLRRLSGANQFPQASLIQIQMQCQNLRQLKNREVELRKYQ